MISDLTYANALVSKVVEIGNEEIRISFNHFHPTSKTQHPKPHTGFHQYGP